MNFNVRIIAEFRANGGTVTTAGFGDNLVLLHTVGAKSGEPRIHPLMAIEAEGGWLVAASAAGAPRHPAWFFNLQATPDVAVETGTATKQAVARILTGAERAEAWAKFERRSSAFTGYQLKTEREIPVILLSRR